MMKDKKGQLGMDTAKTFLLGLMTLLIIGVTTMIVLNSLGDSNALSSTDSVAVLNETGAYINSTGYEFTNQGVGTITVTEARNATDGTVIGSGNYTVTDGKLYNATATTYDDVNVDYTYQINSDSQNVVSNGTDAISDFFTNTSIWLSLLAIAVLILIIAVVIGVVNGFGSSRRNMI